MTNFTDIRDFLRAHCARYPELALQDVFKALYQSAFGCEHLIADPSAAADYIRAEAARSGDRISELVELLSGDYCRVHLGILQDGLSAETFARLFALSARHEECGREKLEAMLTALQTMADAGELPFSAQETAEAVERWRKDGFPPLHHSEIFRQNYAPAYRVLRRDFARALPLFARIDHLTAEKDRVLVAIEGGSASGKTTLGELLQNVYGCPVFHMDDFFLRPEQRTEARFTQPGGNVDRERFLEEVLIPLREGRRSTTAASTARRSPLPRRSGLRWEHSTLSRARTPCTPTLRCTTIYPFFCRFRQKNSASASSNGMRPRMQSSFSTAGSLSSSAISTRSMCGTAAISSFRRTIK